MKILSKNLKLLAIQGKTKYTLIPKSLQATPAYKAEADQ
jgi:hypothetical protein